MVSENNLSSLKPRAMRAGQDGSYLTRFLLEKGYEVHGIIRRASLFNTDRIDQIYHDPHVSGLKLTLHYGDLADGSTSAHGRSPPSDK
jgi:GDP-D-mannose dehydratase